MIYWIIFMILLHGTRADPGFSISSPSEYTALSGEIKMKYVFPRNISHASVDIELVYLQDGVKRREIKINAITLAKENNKGMLTYTCGVVHRAGHYYAKIIMNNKVMVRSKTLVVIWPRFEMSTAPTLTSLTSDLAVNLATADALCEPKNINMEFMLEVVYYGSKDTRGDLTGALNIQGIHKNRVQNEINTEDADLTIVGQSLHIDIVDFNKMRETSNFTLTFNCQLFIQLGEYAVIFRAGENSLLSVIARTRRFTVTSNQDTTIKPPNTAQPCYNRGLTVHYEGPRCKSNIRDRIRIYQQIADSSIPSPLKLKFIVEKVPKQKRTSITFPCVHFMNTTSSPGSTLSQTTDRYSDRTNIAASSSNSQLVVGYCFEYVSVVKSAVILQDKKCIPLNKNTVVDGHWSQWSPWGECSVTCGTSGQRSRTRSCDSPRQTHGGRACTGSSVQFGNCGQLCKAPRTTPSYPTFEPSEAECRCGCRMRQLKGRIAAMTPNCRGSSLWSVQVPRKYVVKVTFKVLTLDVSDRRTILKIRDGGSGKNLLSLEYGREFGELPVSVVSTSNELSVVFESPREKLHGRYGFTVQGFVLEYNVLENNATLLSRPFLLAGLESWQAIAVLSVTGVCVCLFLVSVCCACRHQLKQRARRHKKQAVHRALLDPAPTTPCPLAPHTTARGHTTAVPASPMSSFSSLRSTPEHRRVESTPANVGHSSGDVVDFIDEVSSLERPVVRRVDHRPPVEGRDSFPRQLSDPYQQLIPRDGKDLELYNLCSKNSKDNGGDYYLAPAVDLSPLAMQKTILFDDKDIPTSPSIQLEYDDIPEIPGSILTMPQTAYQLTWADVDSTSTTLTKQKTRQTPVMSTFC